MRISATTAAPRPLLAFNDLQLLHQLPVSGRNGEGLVRLPVDVDVGEPACCGGFGSARPEHREVVAHRGSSKVLDRHPDLSRLGISQARIEAAVVLDDEADDRARRRVEQTRLHALAVRQLVRYLRPNNPDAAAPIEPEAAP